MKLYLLCNFYFIYLKKNYYKKTISPLFFFFFLKKKLKYHIIKYFIFLITCLFCEYIKLYKH